MKSPFILHTRSPPQVLQIPLNPYSPPILLFSKIISHLFAHCCGFLCSEDSQKSLGYCFGCFLALYGQKHKDGIFLPEKGLFSRCVGFFSPVWVIDPAGEQNCVCHFSQMLFPLCFEVDPEGQNSDRCINPSQESFLDSFYKLLTLLVIMTPSVLAVPAVPHFFQMLVTLLTSQSPLPTLVFWE